MASSTSHPSFALHAVLLIMMCFCAGSNGQEQLVYIGRTLYLPTTNLGHAITPLRSIFEGNLSRFLVEEDYIRIFNTRRFHESSQSMLNELSTTFGLSGSALTIELSLEASFNVLTGRQANVTSSLVTLESYSKRTFLRPEVQRSVVKIPLRDDFLEELRSLPDLPSPTPDSEWGSYRNFFLKWGSHYISAIYYGSWLRQWSVAASSQRYSQRGIEARACAKLTGVASIPSINGCANFSMEEMNQALSLQTNDEIEVRGGSGATASAISIRRSEELITTFLNEGRNSNEPVRYAFLPIWRPVLDAYPTSSSKEWRVATALEAYFNGFLAFDCRTLDLTSRNLTLQQFRRKSTGFYECVRTCVGCKRNADCHLAVTGGCYCYGATCVIAQPPDGRPIIQESRDNLSFNDLPNRSCFYNIPNCVCDTTSKELNCGQDGFIPIWSQDN